MSGMDIDRIVGIASDLLAIPSTADRPAEVRRALDFVLDIAGPGFTVERFESAGKPSALIYAGPLRQHFRIILNAHVDVIPAGPDQFRPRIDGRRLYARGAQDMKVSALVQTMVFRELAAVVPYSLALQLVTDEEVGGRHGTLHQIQQGVSADFVVIGEYSALNVVTQSKGMIVAVLRAEGLAAHSAYPWLGDNALIKLHDTLSKLLASYPVPTLEAWQTTMNIARIDTPNEAYNQVPAQAAALIDIRFPPEDQALSGKTVAEITAHLASFCEPGVTATVQQASPPHHARADRAEVGSLRAAAERFGYRSQLLRRHGASDGRYYSQQGTDAVLFGIDGHGQHSADEYADIGSILAYYGALKEFLNAPW
jgi:succinyl-diaminopimelate desuccinylase